MENLMNEIIEYINGSLNDDKHDIKKKLLNPIAEYLGKQLMPYVLCTALFGSILLLLILYIAFTIHKINKIS